MKFRRSIRPLSPLLAATLLLTTSNAWLFTNPVRADRLDASNNGICAVPGKDGVGSLAGIINTYYPGATGASVAVGATSIPVGTLNAAGSSTAIQAGDLLLVIQMQDADINSTDSAAYGDGTTGDVPVQSTAPPSTGASGVTALNNVGRYEYVVATGPVAGGAVPISSGTQYSYRNVAGTATTPKRVYQVVRVPQYSTATVNGTLTTSAQWNGTSGGIVVLDVAQQLTFAAGSAIDVNGLGFRGGGSNPNGVTNSGGATTNPSLFRTTSAGNAAGTNAPKGEGIAGTPRLVATQPFGSFNVRSATTTTDLLASNYPNGDEGRGAPGNAGGGGNEHNAGGGGGANGGDGGMGGRSYNGHNNGTTTTFDAFVGGFGGKAIAPDPLRLLLGGGGGAGDTNNQAKPSGAGGGGGGLVIVRAGNIAGSGTINARGADGIDSPAGSNPDAGGGGGAGGTVLITTGAGNASGITINAQGGVGGDLNENGTVELDGPGGGGGSGIAYVNGAAVNATSGNAGLVVNATLRNNTSNGATAGQTATGTPPIPTPATLTSSVSGASCLLQVAKSTSTPGPLVAPGTAVYTITASNPTGAKRAEAKNVTIAEAGLPTGLTNASTTVTPVYSGGATGPATVTTAGSTTQPTWSGFSIPPGGSVAITFTTNIASGTAVGKYDNSAIATAQYINSSANVTTVGSAGAISSSYDGTLVANKSDDVTIQSASLLLVDKTVALFTDRDGSGLTIPTPGDILEYTIVTTNPTATAIDGVVLKDSIPANTTYVPGSLQITTGANTGIKTDAAGDDQGELASNQVVVRLGTGANGTAGGSLNNSSSTIKFRVRISDPILPAGTTQLSNQAVVSSTGYGDKPSNDPTTPALLDPTLTNLGPRLRLVKRITGIKRPSGAVVSIGGYNDLATDVNDNASAWPGGSNAYLLGAINTSQVPAVPGPPAPKDEIEYTIYFLSDGARAANQVNLCDFIPANQTFVPGTIALNNSGTLTSVADGGGTGPGSGSYNSTATFPSSCTGTNNSRGAIYVQVGNLPSAFVTPASAYGFFRFRATVN